MQRREHQQGDSETETHAASAQRTSSQALSDAADLTPRQLTQRRHMQALFGAATEGQADGHGPVRARSAPLRGNDTGMPDQLKSNLEAMSGMDLSDVRVHRDSAQPAQLNALAYAQGNEIHLAPGQEQHLPHEAWHVVQQRQGRVQANTQLAGVGINDDVRLEQEADERGRQAASGIAQRVEADAAPACSTAAAVQAKTGGPVVQRLFIGDQSQHHMHVGPGVHQPHYKNGNSQASRINIGSNQNYRKTDMEDVIDVLNPRAGESGAQDCIDWCRQQCRQIIDDAGGRAALRG